ncbi:MAG: hypothetical protein ABIG95_04690 [Candidatus Woesearchaeota archaeon]
MSNYTEKYDLDGVAFDSLSRRGRKEYELEQHDRESLKQISLKLEQGLYTDPLEVREHLEYIENLIEEIGNIVKLEEQLGIVNLTLKRDFLSIKLQFDRLGAHLTRLESSRQ